MQKIIILSIVVFFSLTVESQEIYTVNANAEIQIIDLDDFTVTDLFTVPIDEGDLIFDIAFSSDGRLFGVEGGGDIMEIDLVNESFSIIGAFPNNGMQNFPGLIATADNKLLSSETETGILYSYDLDTGETMALGTEIRTSGDFTFYKGNVIWPRHDGFIRTFNPLTTDVTRVSCIEIANYAFVSVFENCNNSTIYGFGIYDGRLYTYDIEGETVNQIANLGSQIDNIFGAATTTEFLGSICQAEILDEGDCVLVVEEFEKYDIGFYPNPVRKAITINSSVNLNGYSYTIWDINGRKVQTGVLENPHITIERINSGVYFLEINNLEGIKIHREKIIYLPEA